MTEFPGKIKIEFSTLKFYWMRILVMSIDDFIIMGVWCGMYTLWSRYEEPPSKTFWWFFAEIDGCGNHCHRNLCGILSTANRQGHLSLFSKPLLTFFPTFDTPNYICEASRKFVAVQRTHPPTDSWRLWSTNRRLASDWDVTGPDLQDQWCQT